MSVVKYAIGDCLELMREMDSSSVDSIITDPPYGLKFMNKKWDYQIPSVEHFKEMLRVAKPGAFLLCFGGTRTYHRMAVNVEDAGWEIRDCIMWLYGSGFPKSHDISKAIDKRAGMKRPVVSETKSGGYKRLMINNAEQGYRPDDYYPDGNKFTSNEAISSEAQVWNGYGTALKPAYEPIIVAMKPLDGTFANNALEHGVSGLWIDGGRVGVDGSLNGGGCESIGKGRWPANVILDEEAGAALDAQSGELSSGKPTGTKKSGTGYHGNFPGGPMTGIGDTGGASRFFYCAKASRSERNIGCEDIYWKLTGKAQSQIGKEEWEGLPAKKRAQGNIHPTVKPLALMEYLCKLTRTPRYGVVLDPYCGSGSTLMACLSVERDAIGFELDAENEPIIRSRLESVSDGHKDLEGGASYWKE